MVVTVKEYLMQVRTLDTKVRVIDNEIKELRDEIAALRSSWPDGQPHGTGTTDPVGNQAAKLADKLTRLEMKQLRTRAQLWRKRAEVIETLSLLTNDTHYQVLNLRYVQHLRWEQIADEMGYTKHHVYKIHGWALHELKQKMIPNDT